MALSVKKKIKVAFYVAVSVSVAACIVVLSEYIVGSSHRQSIRQVSKITCVNYS